MSDDDFRQALEGLRDTARHLMQASEQIGAAGQALVRTTEAVITAHHEHNDMRETVHNLEGLVLQQSDAIRALRADVQSLRDALDRGRT